MTLTADLNEGNATLVLTFDETKKRLTSITCTGVKRKTQFDLLVPVQITLTTSLAVKDAEYVFAGQSGPAYTLTATPKGDFMAGIEWRFMCA